MIPRDIDSHFCNIFKEWQWPIALKRKFTNILMCSWYYFVVLSYRKKARNWVKFFELKWFICNWVRRMHFFCFCLYFYRNIDSTEAVELLFVLNKTIRFIWKWKSKIKSSPFSIIGTSYNLLCLIISWTNNN